MIQNKFKNNFDLNSFIQKIKRFKLNAKYLKN